MSASNQLDDVLGTDSEDELPPGWEERVTVEGNVYYACNRTHVTQWNHPVTGARKRIIGELPYGWEKKIGDTGYVYFVDHLNQKTTFTDPRLAFAVEDKESSKGIGPLRQRFDSNSTALQVLKGRDLSGFHAVVTGANSGIGFEIVRSLAMHGCSVVLACRNAESAAACIANIRKERPQAMLSFMMLDLCSLTSVKKFAATYKSSGWPLHMLFLNAAVFAPPYSLTIDGLESTFQVNYLSHYYLARLLNTPLKMSAPSRVVVMSSESHRYPSINITSEDDVTFETLSPTLENYSPMGQYGTTKLLNIAFANEFNRRLLLHRVYTNSVHPGNLINTSLGRHWWGYRVLFSLARPFTKSLQQAAATPVFTATSPDLENVGGMYLNHCWVCEPSPVALNVKVGEAIWRLSEQIIISKMGHDAFSLDANR